jgi:outer membrane protein assembly factor BamB
MLIALDELTGKRVWTREFGCFHCGLAASGGRLYASGSPGNPEEGPGALYALDARTGKTLWSARTPDADYTSASPVLAAGRVFVRTLSRVSDTWVTSIEAFSAANGRHLWHASTRPSSMFWFMPVSADGSLVVYASEHGYLYAFDAATGVLRWEVYGITNTLRPAIVGGLVWAEDVDGRLLALDARDGRQLWASTPFGLDQLGSPVIAGSSVLVGVKDGPLLAYHVR